jgi:hypothetical protein
MKVGSAITQAVSRRIPTVAARARAQITSCSACGGESCTAVGLLRVLRFPLPIIFPQSVAYSSIIRGWH